MGSQKRRSKNKFWPLAAIIFLVGLTAMLAITCRQGREGTEERGKEGALPAEKAGHTGHAAEAERQTMVAEHQHGIETPASASGEKAEARKKEKKTLYHCPMHPNYISDKPGECPICGMTLVPLQEEEQAAMVMPEGAVQISPEKQQLIGIKIGLVEFREMERDISAVASVTYDETRLATVTTKFSGWIEELLVDYTGKLVHQGQPLFSLYSPDLVSAQEEYLLARRAQKIFSSLASGTSSDPNSLLEAARRRLLLWDISEAQIARLEKEGQPLRTLTISSPVTGFVLSKNALRGKYIMAGEELYRIADISRVWVLADIYEHDLSFISPGMEATFELASFPGEEFKGKISYIYPYLEKETRTVKVRLEVSNPNFRLKPEMFGRAKFHLRLGRRLAVPESAVLDSGERKLVFVARGQGYFEPRETRLGVLAGDYYEVLDGLKEGEEVVTSAQFLVDSESRLKAAVKGLHQHASEGKPAPKKTPETQPHSKHND